MFINIIMLRIFTKLTNSVDILIYCCLFMDFTELLRRAGTWSFALIQELLSPLLKNRLNFFCCVFLS